MLGIFELGGCAILLAFEMICVQCGGMTMVFLGSWLRFTFYIIEKLR
jgi:hypothetical protein